MGIWIRPATRNDHEAINRIAVEGHEPHVLEIPEVFAATDQVFPFEWLESILEAEDQMLFVAENEGILAGYAVIEIKEAPRFATFVPRRFAYIPDIAVSKRFQRRGIGTELFRACMDWAKEQGATSVELTVWTFNEQAIRFYESLGLKAISAKMFGPIE